MFSEEEKGFHIMAKPYGPVCNLRCRYCFYVEKEGLLTPVDHWRMSDEVLEAYIKKYIRLNRDAPEVPFAWQGGEPTMRGLDFFRRVVELQMRHAGDVPITNALQTNGTLLNAEWCRFLARHRFLVGLSLDGPAAIHDRHRRARGGKPTHQRVMRSLRLLQDHDVDVNILACVARETAHKPREVYHFFKRQGVRFIQFIPLVERLPDGASRGRGLQLAGPPAMDQAARTVTAWSVEPGAYGRFLAAIFDEWIRNDVGRTMVMNFEWALNSWLGNDSPVCHFARTCGRSLILEHNGDLYACDHFVYPVYRVGNILADDLETVVNSPAQAAFGLAKEALGPACRDCWALFACRGGCPKHRFVPGPDGQLQNYLCAGYEHYFRHINKYMRAMAHLMAHGQPAAAVMQALDGPLVIKLENPPDRPIIHDDQP